MKMLIYKITNLLNGKIYIGQTKYTIEKRFLQHSKADSPLGQAMRQFGMENFTVEVIEECETQEDLNEREKFWIKVLNSKQPNGYNRNDDGGVCQQFSRENLYKNKFSERIKFLRKHQEFTQVEVAEKLKINSTTYSKYECGTTEPDINTLRKLANFFNVSIDYLLENDCHPSDSDNMVDLNNFILYGNYTIDSRCPTKEMRKLLNEIISSISRYDCEK